MARLCRRDGTGTGWGLQRHPRALKLHYLCGSGQLRLCPPESVGTPQSYVLGQGCASLHAPLRVISTASSTSTAIQTPYSQILTSTLRSLNTMPEYHQAGFHLTRRSPSPHLCSFPRVPSKYPHPPWSHQAQRHEPSWPPGTLSLAFHSCSICMTPAAYTPILSIHSVIALVGALEPSLA